MVYVESIEANVKGQFSYDLGPKTLVVGDNRSGKTRITEALSLALTGVARTPYLTKYDYEVIALKPLSAKKLFAQASLSDDGLARYELSGSTAGTAKKKHTVISGEGTPVPQPAAVVVSDLVQTLMRGDSKKLSHAILRTYGQPILAEILLADCPPQLREQCKNLFDRPDTDDAIDATKIIEVIESLDKTLYALRREAKGIETALNHLTDDPLTDDEITQLGLLNAALAGKDLQQRVKDQLLKQKSRLEAEIERIRGEIALLDDAPTAAINVQLLNNVHVVLGNLERLMREKGAERCACPVCLSPDVTLTQFEVTRERVHDGLNYYQDVRDLTHIERQLLQLQEELDRLERTPALGEFGDDPERIQGLIAALEQKRADTNRAVELRFRQQQCSANIEEYVAIQKILRSIIRRMLRSAVRPFCEAVNEVLPSGFKVDLILKAGRRDVCHLALDAPSAVPHLSGSLSGAEIALLTVAVAHALARVAWSYVRMLIIDDVWIDANIMRTLVEAVDRLFTVTDRVIDQVVVCAVKAEVPLPDDWKKIALS